MIPERIQALFQFIDFLDVNKETYINTYLPIVEELESLRIERNKLKPEGNYKDRIKYAEVQEVISRKFELVYQNVSTPILNKLLELKIWNGEEVYTSIYNMNIGAVQELKERFSIEDVKTIQAQKEKYINFRAETNSYFLSLQFPFEYLDEVLKSLFDYFKDVQINEFEKFVNEPVQVNSLSELLNEFQKGNNVVLPFDLLLNGEKQINTPEPTEEIKPTEEEPRKLKSEHYALTYIFDCHAIGESILIGQKTELEKIGKQRADGAISGNTFYKAVTRILKGYNDLNVEKTLIEIAGEDWKEILSELTKYPVELKKYLQSKQL